MYTCLLIALACSAHIVAYQNIDQAHQTLKQVVAQNNPTAMSTFNELFSRYNTVVYNFFDLKNNDSLKKHISHMECELSQLNTVRTDTGFTCIKKDLDDYYQKLGALVQVLKTYTGSHNAWWLAWDLRSFKPLLPQQLLDQGELALVDALQHRLKC